MQCDRLIKLIKSWYGHVKDETMAPARMVSFIEEHAESCDICLRDPDLKVEIAKITELVLPESKIPKAVRQQNNKVQEEEAVDEEETNEDENEEETSEDEHDDDDLDEEDELQLDDTNLESGSDLT